MNFSTIIYLILLKFMFITEVSAIPSTRWELFVDKLNAFRRAQAKQLEAANLQKIYWDDKLLGLAHQKLASFDELYAIRNDRKTTFWMEMAIQSEEVRADLYFQSLTKIGEHKDDTITEKSWNSPFNLAINHHTIRVGCAERNTTKTVIVLCVFGPSPILVLDPLYTRGPICSECPLKTGCHQELCDEMTREPVPPLDQLIGFDYPRNTQIMIVLLIFLFILAIIVGMVFVYIYI